MILQLIPIPGLSGVHFGKESYIMLVVWIVIGLVFYNLDYGLQDVNPEGAVRRRRFL